MNFLTTKDAKSTKKKKVVSGQRREILRCAENDIQDNEMKGDMLMRCMGMFFVEDSWNNHKVRMTVVQWVW